jgi:uncharacterized protein YlzI (FlbEa/FlbD family)
MPKFICLTDEDGQEIFVNPEHIITMQAGGSEGEKFTRVIVERCGTVIVKESPRTIARLSIESTDTGVVER